MVVVMGLWLIAAIAAYLAAWSGHRQLSHLIHWALIGSFCGLVFAVLTQDFHRLFWMRIQTRCSPGVAFDVSRAYLALTGFAPLIGTLAGAISVYVVAFAMRREPQSPNLFVRLSAVTGRIAGRFFH